MKFLHLADLHIGKSVNGFSMLEEQANAFRQIKKYVQSERPAAVLIAGDVYDRAVPSVEAVRLFDDFLTDLAHEKTVVLLIAGNHDSPERIGFANRLLSEQQLFLRGIYDENSQPVTLSDEYGEVHFWPLPFLKPSDLRENADTQPESYQDAFALALDRMPINLTQRNVLIAHQFFAAPGIVPLFSESELNPIGGLDAIDAALLRAFDYTALGHLHRSQTIGRDVVRYAGSPIKYSFSECRHEKSVTMVELGAKGDLHIRELPITPLHDMREIKGSLELLLSDEIAGQEDPEDYLRVILTDEEEIIDPLGKVRSVYKNVMSLDFENTRTQLVLDHISTESENVATTSPYDLFNDFFLEINGNVMSLAQCQLVMELMETEAKR